MVATASCSKADGMPPPLKQRHPYICRPSQLFWRDAPKCVPCVCPACEGKDSARVSRGVHACVVSHDNFSDTLVTTPGAWRPPVAVKAGAELHTDEAVRAWRSTSAGVVVETDRGTYSAGRLIVAAGPWAGRTWTAPSSPPPTASTSSSWMKPSTGWPPATPRPRSS